MERGIRYPFHLVAKRGTVICFTTPSLFLLFCLFALVLCHAPSLHCCGTGLHGKHVRVSCFDRLHLHRQLFVRFRGKGIRSGNMQLLIIVSM